MLKEMVGFLYRERRRRLADPAYDATQLDQTQQFRVRARRVAVYRRLQSVVQTVAEDRSAEVVLDIPRALYAVVDVDALDRIAANVILNALRYGKPPVTVSARVRQGMLLISFEDCGRGVASEFVPHLFKRGARSEASQLDADGSGVGLTLSRFYARVLGGDLVYEERADEGARFTLLLPRTPTVYEWGTLDRIKSVILVPVAFATARLNACETPAVCSGRDGCYEWFSEYQIRDRRRPSSSETTGSCWPALLAFVMSGGATGIVRKGVDFVSSGIGHGPVRFV